LESAFAEPVSLTLPLSGNKFSSNVMFPFFDGLIPEGWLLEIAERNWKLNPRDRMGILLATCRDCIGAVSVEPFETE
jgi:serine/threonine-protein kinase HipA